jgi:hypothetical protein
MLTDYEISLLFRAVLALWAMPKPLWEETAELRRELQAAADRHAAPKSDGGAI